jgi:hypothetical protein
MAQETESFLHLTINDSEEESQFKTTTEVEPTTTECDNDVQVNEIKDQQDENINQEVVDRYSTSETDSGDEIYKMYLVLINNETRCVANTKAQAVLFVENMAKELLDFYSADNSVYRVFLTVKDDTYCISGHYKFMTIQSETVFETLTIKEIEKID